MSSEPIWQCPIHREPLSREGDEFVGASGERYPVVDEIPVLLPDAQERVSVAGLEGSEHEVDAGQAGTAAAFYNQTRDHDQYCRSSLDETRGWIESWIEKLGLPGSGTVLEIGSGKGALQGIGERYMALDYSFSALRTYVRPEHDRVCGTASQLPLPDASVSMVFTVAALEHVPEAGDSIREIERVLMPGGWAFLLPAWHCTQANCEGLPVRPYGDLSVSQKLRKVVLPVTTKPLVKAAMTLPGRAARRTFWALRGRPAQDFAFRRLRPTYDTFYMSDSDAASRLDSHEACLFFSARGYDVLSHPTGKAQLLARHESVVVRKP